MKITTWNINGIRSLPLNAILSLSSDITCLQEVKADKQTLLQQDFIPHSSESYFSIPQVNATHYSGVATLLSENLGASSARLHLIDPTNPVDKEGRTAITDLGLFILINVYCPNAGNNERLEFKISFLSALRSVVEDYNAQGRQVVVLGDLNCCYLKIDLAEQSEFDPESPSTKWLNALFRECEMVDLFRHFHPEDEKAYTCWSTLINARIDFILCSKGLVEWFKDCWIESQVTGSDHCPVVAEMHSTHPITGEPLNLSKSSNIPECCAKLWKGSRKQATLHSFLQPNPKRSKIDHDTKVELGSFKNETKTEESAIVHDFESKPTIKVPEEIPEEFQTDSRKEAKQVFASIFSKPNVPSCHHNGLIYLTIEPCVKLKVNKAGPNKGKYFFMCNRPVGPKETKLGEFRCNYFMWFHDHLKKSKK